MSASHHYERPIRFADTDMAGVAHFTAAAVLVEEAWHSWLGRLGESIHPAVAPGGAEPVGWPVVSFSIDFFHPLRLGELACVHLVPERIGTKGVTLGFSIRVAGAEVAASGKFSIVCAMESGGRWHSRPIPETLAAILRPQSPEH